MTPEKPIFDDCAFPEDCECAKRGYEHETDSCGAWGVIAFARMSGLDPRGLFGGKEPPERPRPLPPATDDPE